jgi:uncharacterized membrane protein
MKEKVKESWDLVGIVLLSVILVLSIILLPDFPLRIVIGLPFLLFFPGYALIAFLFPEIETLDTIERIALSFGLSIAVTPLIGFALNFTPFGIRLEPILLCITAFNIAFCLLAYWRRYRVDGRYLPLNPKMTFLLLKAQYLSEGKVDRALSIVLVVAIGSSLIALAYVIAVPREGESFTEFYLLGPGHQASDYPHNLTVDENANVYVGIVNHENRQVHYYVQTWLVNANFVNNETIVNKMYYLEQFDVVLDYVPVNLEGEWTPQWEYNYSFAVPIEGQYKLWFFLFMDQVPWYAEDMTYMYDYAETPSTYLIEQAVNNELLSLNLNLNIRAA